MQKNYLITVFLRYICKFNSQEHFLSRVIEEATDKISYLKKKKKVLSVKSFHYVSHIFSLVLIEKSLKRSPVCTGRDLILLVKALFQLVTLNNELMLCFYSALASLYEERKKKYIYIYFYSVYRSNSKHHFKMNI